VSHKNQPALRYYTVTTQSSVAQPKEGEPPSEPEARYGAKDVEDYLSIAVKLIFSESHESSYSYAPWLTRETAREGRRSARNILVTERTLFADVKRCLSKHPARIPRFRILRPLTHQRLEDGKKGQVFTDDRKHKPTGSVGAFRSRNHTFLSAMQKRQNQIIGAKSIV
jgi:hypothetical protein